MIFITYTIAAVILYLVSDFILENIEIKLGRRLSNRSLVFFIIISVLAVTSFGAIQIIFDRPMTRQPASPAATMAPDLPASQNRIQTTSPTSESDASGNH